MTDTIITANKSAKRVWMRDFVNHRIADRGLRMVGDYVTAHTKSTFECADGHRWDARPDSVMHRSGCPFCSGRRRD